MNYCLCTIEGGCSHGSSPKLAMNGHQDAFRIVAKIWRWEFEVTRSWAPKCAVAMWKYLFCKIAFASSGEYQNRFLPTSALCYNNLFVQETETMLFSPESALFFWSNDSFLLWSSMALAFCIPAISSFIAFWLITLKLPSSRGGY